MVMMQIVGESKPAAQMLVCLVVFAFTIVLHAAPNPFEFEAAPKPETKIDEIVFARLQKLGIEPANVCSDGVFIRRAYLDVIGTLPTAVETPHWETDFTVTPSPHHPIGAKGVGESPNVGGVPAFSNAVNDAFSFLGSTHIQMPHDFWRNWKAAKDLGAVA